MKDGEKCFTRTDKCCGFDRGMRCMGTEQMFNGRGFKGRCLNPGYPGT